MERVVRAYWDCQYCGTKEIDGLTDLCPNCGKQKSKDTKCYMKAGVIEYVSDEELKAAKINKDECDGNHKDWICNYCDQLNNYADEQCIACGSPKTQATHEYGMTPIKTEYNDNYTDDNKDSTYYDESNDNDNFTVSNNTTDFSEDTYKSFDTDTNYSNNHSNKRIDMKSILKFSGITAGVIALLSLIVFLFYPLKHEVSIVAFSWERTITVEEERTVKEDAWSVPNGGRVYDEKREFKEYVTVIDHYETVNETKTRQVIDHYETVTETKTRQVIDHYETTYTYRDNGNGTYSEIPNREPVYKTETYTESHQEPVYKTETYIESHQEPVYRQDAVYATRYYYEIEKWFYVQDYTSSGLDQNAYWNTNYTLKSNERDTKRSEKYYIYYSDNTSNATSYNEWMNCNKGDGFIITKNRLGIIYSKEPINH